SGSRTVASAGDFGSARGSGDSAAPRRRRASDHGSHYAAAGSAAALLETGVEARHENGRNSQGRDGAHGAESVTTSLLEILRHVDAQKGQIQKTTTRAYDRESLAGFDP